MRRLYTSEEPPVEYLNTEMDIDMGEWRVDSDFLFTSGASTCILLAAWNSKTRTGLMGHFRNLLTEGFSDSDREAYDLALDAINNLGEPSETTIWLGGAAIHGTEVAEAVETDRHLAETAVQSRCSTNESLTVEWASDDRLTAAELDCRMGILIVRQYDRAI